MEHNSNLESAILTALSEASLYGVTELTDDILFYILYRDESYGIIKKTLYSASISSYELKALLNTLYDMQPNAEKREVPYSQETLNTLAKAEEYAMLSASTRSCTSSDDILPFIFGNAGESCVIFRNLALTTGLFRTNIS